MKHRRILVVLTILAAFVLAGILTAGCGRKTNIEKISVEVTEEPFYTGSPVLPTLRLSHGDKELKEGRDYTCSAEDNTEVGKAAVTITGTGSYTGSIELPFNINPAPVDLLSGIKSMTYTGQPLTQDAVVTSGETQLTEGTDYTVSYENNKLIGKAYITVRGRGNYTGSLTKSFTILPKSVWIKGTDETEHRFTARWEEPDEETDGFELQYSLDESFQKDVTNVTVKDAGKTSMTFDKLDKDKPQFIRIRAYKDVGGETFCSVWSPARATDGFISVSENKRGAVTVSTAAVYKGADKHAEQLEALPFGSKVFIKKKKGNWYYIARREDDQIIRGYMNAVKVVMYDKTKKHLALTFDDGPRSDSTPVVLKALKKTHCRATFFIVGSNVTNKTSDLIRQEKELGCELGNHSLNHALLTNLKKKDVKHQLHQTDALVKEAAGSAPTVCRAPYGSANDKILALMKRPHILWSVDTLDWKYRNTKSLIRTVKSSKKDGAIILMHDIHMSTAKGIGAICRNLKKQGYETVTVTELAAIKGVTLKNGKTYYSFGK